MPLAGRPLIAHTISVFQTCPHVDEIVLVMLPEQVEMGRSLVEEYDFTKVAAVVPGGEVRQDSVRNGLAAVSPDSDIIAIHDGARPLVTPDIISSSIEGARSHGAVIAAVPVIDTIKSSEDGRLVNSTLDRSHLYAVQTPQTFARHVIMEAYERAYADGFYGTDDSSLVERTGHAVHIVHGSYENIKVTTPSDLIIAEAIMQSRQPSAEPSFRVGHGYDIHRFAPGRKLYLGGVEFPDEEGLLGHSDADVVLHAIADALLGAACAGDIGRHFPDSDPAFKDARSTVLLRRVAQLICESGWRIGNVDVTVIAERPKIATHVSAMQVSIARCLGTTPEQVSLKGKTSERLGPVGEGLGIECHAVVLLVRGS